MVVGSAGCSADTAEETNKTASESIVEEESAENDPVGTSELTVEEESLENYPVIGTWKAEGECSYGDYWKIQESGEVTPMFVLTNTSTLTVNGVTKNSTTSSLQTMPVVPYKIQGETVMYNGTAPFKMTFDGTDYKLVGEKGTYIRIGDIDYEIVLEDSAENGENSAEATAYVLGESIIAENIEMQLTEKGFSDDIRVTVQRDSGLTITSGPSPEDGKQFFYLKGTLKNTGTQAVRPAIGGTLKLDGYEYDIRIDTISKNGNISPTIEPLDSVILLIYVPVPIELTESFSTGEMVFGFNDNFEDVDIANADYLYSIDVTKE